MSGWCQGEVPEACQEKEAGSLAGLGVSRAELGGEVNSFGALCPRLRKQYVISERQYAREGVENCVYLLFLRD